MTQIGGSSRSPLTRPELAKKRLRSILRTHGVANDRILEQKIADAGPSNQRINPHILTRARQQLIDQGDIVRVYQNDTPWYHLATADPNVVQQRFAVLTALHAQTQQGAFTNRIGQTLEIAVFRALETQSAFTYFGGFRDLNQHDDSTLYSKTEPPAMVSNRDIYPQNVDFMLTSRTTGSITAIEVKNIRQWIYPNREEIRDLLFKCCTLDVVPILIARRIQYSTFSVLNPCGVLLHQTFNQLYPESDSALAAQVRQKDLLGYHDVRLGNHPNARLIGFLHKNLPDILPAAREKFDRFKDLLLDYGSGTIPYRSFAARVKRRTRGEPEDGSAAPTVEGDDTTIDELTQDYPDESYDLPDDEL